MSILRDILIGLPLIIGLDLLAYQALNDTYSGNDNAQQPASLPANAYVEKFPDNNMVVRKSLESMFLTALSQSHLHVSSSGPVLLANSTQLLDTLLHGRFLTETARHIQGDAAVVSSTLQLLHRGRTAAMAPTQQQRQHSLPRWWLLQRHPPNLSTWLADAETMLTRLPAGPSCYPMLRRSIVALLLRAWLAAGDNWSQPNEEAAKRILLKLYKLHRAGAANKSAVELYHFSKAAGTSVCVVSAAAGCTTFSTSESFTCLIPAFEDGPRWFDRQAYAAQCGRARPNSTECPTQVCPQLAKWGVRYPSRGGLLGCEQRAAALAGSGWNFYASEYTLRARGGRTGAPPELCRQFLNLAVLRRPLPRLLSHLRYIVRVTHTEMGNRTADFFRGMRLEDWRRLLPAVTDNYYTRALLGEEGFYVPLGGLKASVHLPAARAALGAMDVLLLLEDRKPLSQLGHKWGLAWNTSFLEANGRRSEAVAPEINRIADEVLPAGPDAAALAAAHSLDQELYDTAALLSRLDAVVWAAAEAAGGGEALQGERSGRCGYVPAPHVPPKVPIPEGDTNFIQAASHPRRLRELVGPLS